MGRFTKAEVTSTLNYYLGPLSEKPEGQITTIEMRLSLNLAFAALVVLMAADLSAQTARLNLYGGYTFQDKFNLSGTYNGYNYNQAIIGDGAHFAGGLEVEMAPNASVEIYYQNQATTGSLDYGLSQSSTDVSANYLMLGFSRYAPASDVVAGFGGLMLGAGWFNSDFGSNTKFAWGGRLGLRLTASESLAIKLGAQLLSPVQGAGGGLYFGTGGAGAGVSTYSTVYQFGFFGGLCFTFGGSGGGSARPAPRSAMPPPPPPPPPGR